MTNPRKRRRSPVPHEPSHRRAWRSLWRRCSCGLPAPCVDRLVPPPRLPFPPNRDSPAPIRTVDPPDRAGGFGTAQEPAIPDTATPERRQQTTWTAACPSHPPPPPPTRASPFITGAADARSWPDSPLPSTTPHYPTRPSLHASPVGGPIRSSSAWPTGDTDLDVDPRIGRTQAPKPRIRPAFPPGEADGTQQASGWSPNNRGDPTCRPRGAAPLNSADDEVRRTLANNTSSCSPRPTGRGEPGNAPRTTGAGSNRWHAGTAWRVGTASPDSAAWPTSMSNAGTFDDADSVAWRAAEDSPSTWTTSNAGSTADPAFWPATRTTAEVKTWPSTAASKDGPRQREAAAPDEPQPSRTAAKHGPRRSNTATENERSPSETTAKNELQPSRAAAKHESRSGKADTQTESWQGDPHTGRGIRPTSEDSTRDGPWPISETPTPAATLPTGPTAPRPTGAIPPQGATQPTSGTPPRPAARPTNAIPRQRATRPINEPYPEDEVSSSGADDPPGRIDPWRGPQSDQQVRAPVWAGPTVLLSQVGRAGDLTPAQEYRAGRGRSW